MNIEVSEPKVREAAVINMLETAQTPELLDRVKTELWCIREGIDTTKHPEIWDVTLGYHPTSEIVDIVLYTGPRNKHDQAAFLLCTIQELS